MQEISLHDFEYKLLNLRKLYFGCYWRSSFTTEYDVKEQAILYIKNKSDNHSVVKAALQVIESKGHLKFIEFEKEGRQEYIIPFYDTLLAFQKFNEITS